MSRQATIPLVPSPTTSAKSPRRVRSACVPHILELDSLIVLSVIAREVPHIEVGTAVIPVYPRHPMLMAQQALTTQFAANGRLVLGLGVGHQIQMEGMLGYSTTSACGYTREYLNALLPMLRGSQLATKANGS